MNNKNIVKLSGRVQDLNKVIKNEKPKQTNYLLTINTNQQYKSDDKNLENDIEFFNNTIDNILSNIDEYVKLPERDAWTDKLIKSCDIDYTIERGTIKNQLHIHIMFKIRHFTKIQLDYGKIKSKISTDLGLNNIYLYNRLLKPNESDNVNVFFNYCDDMTKLLHKIQVTTRQNPLGKHTDA